MSSLADTNLYYKDKEHSLHGTWLSVDVISITEDSPPKIVLITRKGTPHKGETTLPGGLVASWDNETIAETAARIVREKVGVEPISDSVTVDVVSDRNRDERGHTVSVVVVLRVPSGTKGAVPVDDVPENMPFKHTDILKSGLLQLRSRVLTDPQVTYALLGEETTVQDTAALLGFLNPDISDTAARARLDRCGLYRRSAMTITRSVGRPSHVYLRDA